MLQKYNEQTRWRNKNYHILTQSFQIQNDEYIHNMTRYKLNIYNIYKHHKSLHFHTEPVETHHAEHIIYIKITTGGMMGMVGGKLSE